MKRSEPPRTARRLVARCHVRADVADRHLRHLRRRRSTPPARGRLRQLRQPRAHRVVLHCAQRTTCGGSPRTRARRVTGARGLEPRSVELLHNPCDQLDSDA
jgi:hypothetical protein